jgi:prolyl oligopeptidase
MTTGDNDPRVDPMHSRKMIARLQTATSSKAPILLRTSASAGHGMGTALDEQLEEAIDTFAFLFAELGVKYKPVAPKH